MSKKCKSLFEPTLIKQLKKQLLEELIFRERFLRQVYKSYSSINLNVRHDNEDFQKQKPKYFFILFDEK